ncbi:hypothetical protein ACFRAO_42735 [Streptomyces sp. NPDC056656]|uniref:hypothetical protein n=1 Tax=Streptomyces sp. NPDC056656 TaxID=3345895 RepID=UPI00369FAC68
MRSSNNDSRSSASTVPVDRLGAVRADSVPASGQDATKTAAGRKQVLLRLHPHLYDALARWAGDELRSTNAQIEFLLRTALAEAGRHPAGGPRTVHREATPRSPLDGDPTVLRRRIG